MSLAAICLMIIYLAVVGGLLVAAALHLGKTNDEETGLLANADLDQLPAYTKTS